MKALIFDLDGTLADSLGDIVGALNHTLGTLGLPQHSAETVRPWIGWGARYLVENAIPADQREALTDDALRRFRARYDDHLVELTAPYDGVTALLDTLSEASVPMSVLSNKPHAMTERLVAELFARWSFVGVRGKRDGAPGKPDPRDAVALAAAMGVASNDRSAVGFIGDTGVDMQTASAAGMTAIGVTWGFRTAAQLAAAGADVIIDHPDELLVWLARSHQL